MSEYTKEVEELLNVLVFRAAMTREEALRHCKTVKGLCEKNKQLEAQIHKNKEDEIKFLKQLKEFQEGFLGKETRMKKTIEELRAEMEAKAAAAKVAAAKVASAIKAARVAEAHQELRAAAVKGAAAGEEAWDEWDEWRAKAKARAAEVRELKESTNDMPSQQKTK